MSNHRTPPPLGERDYKAILDAMLETDRGRWFLGEYVQRNRSEETKMLLAAISTLNEVIAERQQLDFPDFNEQTASMAAEADRIIARLHGELSMIGRKDNAKDIILAAKDAGDRIYNSASKLQENTEMTEIAMAMASDCNAMAEANLALIKVTQALEQIEALIKRSP
jgi:hypothetical protein